jgi:hypothetical protein
LYAHEPNLVITGPIDESVFVVISTQNTGTHKIENVAIFGQSPLSTPTHCFQSQIRAAKDEQDDGKHIEKCAPCFVCAISNSESSRCSKGTIPSAIANLTEVCAEGEVLEELRTLFAGGE